MLKASECLSLNIKHWYRKRFQRINEKSQNILRLKKDEDENYKLGSTSELYLAERAETLDDREKKNQLFRLGHLFFMNKERPTKIMYNLFYTNKNENDWMMRIIRDVKKLNK